MDEKDWKDYLSSNNVYKKDLHKNKYHKEELKSTKIIINQQQKTKTEDFENIDHINDFLEKFNDLDTLKDQKQDQIILGDKNNLDPNFKLKLDSGKYKIDQILDLHYFTLDEAYEQFLKFIFNAIQNHKRLLLIITGKGDPTRYDTINKSFPKWCNHESIVKHISYINYAALKDGGDGAYYLLLRKKMNISKNEQL